MTTTEDLIAQAIEQQIGWKNVRATTIDGADTTERVLAQRTGAVTLDGIVDSFTVEAETTITLEEGRDEETTVRVYVTAVTCLRAHDGRYRVRGRVVFRVGVEGEDRELADFYSGAL